MLIWRSLDSLEVPCVRGLKLIFNTNCSSIMESFEKFEVGVPSGLKMASELVIDLESEECWSVDEPGLKWMVGLTILSFCLVQHCLLSCSETVGLFVFMLPTLSREPSCDASVSDGPVKRCTISRKVFVSVCTNVVAGLETAAPGVAGFSMEVHFWNGNRSLLPISSWGFFTVLRVWSSACNQSQSSS